MTGLGGDILPPGKKRIGSGGSSGSGGSAQLPPVSPSPLHDFRTMLTNALKREGMGSEGVDRVVQEFEAFQAPLSGKKSRLSAAADDLGHVPSDLVVWDVWRKYQVGPTPRFKCHRPFAPPIPLVLLHKPFMDFVSNLGKEPSAEDVIFASKFNDALNNDSYVQEHGTQVYVIVKHMEEYFNNPSKVVRAVFEANIAGVKADACFIKILGVPLFCEFKPQASAGDPEFQNLCYFLRHWTQPSEREEPYSLLLNVSGPHMVEVVAASLQEDGKVVWAEIVASFRCFATSAGRMHELTQAARVWRAVKSFVTQYSAQVRHQGWPVPWCLQSYSNVQQPDKRKLFFTYTDIDDISKAAKLSRMYCTEAHEAWHMCGYAPALHAVDVIGHGWLCIRMEYLAPEKQWRSALDVAQDLKKQGKDQVLEKLKSCLVAGASAGHSQGFVHGDFRLCNLMVKPQSGADGFEVRVLDFDWSGKLGGNTRYPTLLNPGVMWSLGVEYNEIITVDHDKWFLGDGFTDQLA